MNLTNSRLMMILVLSFLGFLRFNELSSLKRSNFILRSKTLICQYSRYSLSYTTVRGHILDLLTNIGLNHKKFGLHSLRSGGALATANLGVNDRLFKKTRWVEVRQSKGQLRSRRYRNKTFSIKEPRSLAITSTPRKYTRLNYYKKLCF